MSAINSERDDLIKANQILHDLLSNREAENARLRSEIEQARGQVEEARISFEAIHGFNDSEMRDGDAARELAERWLTTLSQSPVAGSELTRPDRGDATQ